ncbi:urotensin 1 [Oryzias melastigma]|uniref:urotensin 1 n=1 Tax=Oryzias melastigma TaxID=30732 RepID=UPI00168CC57B|nr:urotensin 1 [Oryzias melastigma]
MKPLLLLLLLSSVLLSAGRPLHLPAGALQEAEVLRFLLYLLPPAGDSGEEALRSAARLLKRSEEPPLSIDLTFHMLRNMIRMAKTQRQRARAQLNRKLLDEVGK